ncbi:AAA domain-containing protein [Planococcus koreensis]|uniref:AAA domain-containing protein n=1 Tax=Planococcus koreensis TaxID=112331 RepID=UPI001080409D|nr:AAA domain-containing protein [Planococcus koreensis]
MDSIEIPFKPVNPKIDLAECKGIFNQLKTVQGILVWRQQTILATDYLTAVNFDLEKIGIFQKNFEVFEKKNELKVPQEYMNNVQGSMEASISDSTNPVYKSLLESMIWRDKQELKRQHESYQHLQKILNRDKLITESSDFLERINPKLLGYLKETISDPAWTIRLQNWSKAAHWRMAETWLKDFSNKNEKDLADEYERTEISIKATITDIGALKAWNSMLTSMTDLQNSHLKAWTKAVKRVGKGTGKNAPRYRKEAQGHMEKCKDAIPAWIMPLYQVFENFEVKPDLFDVVIIDEASQSWHEAILLKYIAKKIIIVGDDKQISPSKIGIQVEDVAKLQNRYLKPIDYPFMDTLNLGNSFFDVAYVLFKNTITLREHFRCMPEIIEFSNRIAYRDQPLFALRQYPANRLEPIKSKYLPHGVREGSSTSAINEVEAKEIVKEIKKCVSNPAYNGKSIGVISLQGNSQASLIQQLLLTEIGAETMEERNIICGDAYAFQGDERDIIFLSMVAAKGTTRLTSLTSEPYRQRFNVAVSRAKDQIWLMHSITVNDINNSDCMRYQLLNYIQNPLKEEQDGNREKCDSQFEKDVFDAIVRKGYRVLTQYEVAGYRIDLVVMGENAKLAVECDGDHWHTSSEDMENDFRRQRVLERAGWSFWRVLGSTYYLNPSKALESLWQRLDEMGIRPYLEWSPKISELADAEEATIDMTTEEINKIKADINNKTRNESSFELGDANVSDLENPSVFDNQQVDVQLPINDELSRAFSILTKNETESEFEALTDSPIAADLIDAISIVGSKENLSANQTLLEYKDLLTNEGFNVLLETDSEYTIVVLGSANLENELERFAPKNNSFSFHKNGFKSTDYLPCWSITLLERNEQNIVKAVPKTKSLNPFLIQEKMISGQRLSEVTIVDQMLEIIKTKGIEVIDNEKNLKPSG